MISPTAHILASVCQHAHDAVFGNADLVVPLHAFADTPAQSDLAPIWAAITIVPTGDHLPDATLLGISYFIPRFDWLVPARWQASATYPVTAFQPLPRVPDECLWQANCLECFFAWAEDSRYVEINISADANNARFNAYQFTDYRTPNTLPPLTTQQFVVQSIAADSIDKQFKKDKQFADFYVRHVAVCLADGAQQITAFVPKLIQPCAILYRKTDKQADQADHAVFFAPQHATPPDFHHQPVWQILP